MHTAAWDAVRPSAALDGCVHARGGWNRRPGGGAAGTDSVACAIVPPSRTTAQEEMGATAPRRRCAQGQAMQAVQGTPDSSHGSDSAPVAHSSVPQAAVAMAPAPDSETLRARTSAMWKPRAIGEMRNRTLGACARPSPRSHRASRRGGRSVLGVLLPGDPSNRPHKTQLCGLFLRDGWGLPRHPAPLVAGGDQPVAARCSSSNSSLAASSRRTSSNARRSAWPPLRFFVTQRITSWRTSTGSRSAISSPGRGST